MTNRTKQRLRGWDPWLMIPMLALSILGIIMVYSASAGEIYIGRSAKSPMIKQTIYLLVGLVVLFIVSRVPLASFRRSRLLMGFFATLAVLLIIVRFFAPAVNGAHGWLTFGPISIQPAEFCKFFLIIYMADRLDHFSHYSVREGRVALVSPAVVCGWLLLWILAQPDTGGFAICLAIIGVMLLAGRLPWRRASAILVGSVGGLAIGMPLLAGLALKVFHGYRAARFVGYLNPFESAEGAGSQLVNSYYAISNGGLFGRGLGNSIQKMGYLPEPNTDFILAVVAEELGLVTVVLILFTLAFLIGRIIQIGARAEDLYQTLICYGSAAFICVEASFNVGAVCGLLPITGVTLPFISYGGSSMVVLCATLGLVMNVSRLEYAARAVPRQTEETNG